VAQTLIWSHEALDDIDRIAEYIGRDSRYHAQQVIERLFELASALPAHPRIGRVVPELNSDEVREQFLYSYRLIYEITGDRVVVLAVIHGKRLLESVERFKP
jgi:addiction module RelE/StbE family toxin